jgi:uncharacterized membrane protein
VTAGTAGHRSGRRFGRLGQLVSASALAVAASFALLLSSAGGARAASPNAGGQPVVRAVLFYSPSCPHCHQVITHDLPPLQRTYGSSLQIAALDIDTAAGWQLYEAAIVQYGVVEARRGVPALYAGDVVLVGSDEIPRLFPGLVDTLLAQGGSDWPAIPGLDEAFSDPGAIPALPGYASDQTSEQSSPISEAIDRAAEDLAGSSLSIVILLALLACFGWALAVASRADPSLVRAPSGLIPPIALAGLAVAAYLAAVEMSGSIAVCGPVGDCNRVHQSEYARLFGVLPVGLLGCTGYVGILAAWAVGRLPDGDPARLARLSLLALAAFGVAFSAYLTFLEPFVIGATCGWCLASAVLMGALLVVATTSMWPPKPAPAPASRRARRAARRRAW